MSDLRPVREWLSDYFECMSGTELPTVLQGVAEREVSSFEEARRHVDDRIDSWIAWLDGSRPSAGAGGPG